MREFFLCLIEITCFSCILNLDRDFQATHISLNHVVINASKK